MSATFLDFSEPKVAPRPGLEPDTDIIECTQGTAEWFRARAGVITASMFREVRKRIGGLSERQRVYVDAVKSGIPKPLAAKQAGLSKIPGGSKVDDAINGIDVGDFTSTAKDYAFRLACERIAGEALRDEKFQTYDMQRGHELEPEARGLHAFRTGMDIQTAGIVRTKDGKFGASADGLIATGQHKYLPGRGGAEYKCFTAAEKVRAILVRGELMEQMDQIQGGIWLTGAHWWHFALYCPYLAEAERELTIIEVERDDDYIEAMEADLIAFDRYVERMRQEILSTPKTIRLYV